MQMPRAKVRKSAVGVAVRRVVMGEVSFFCGLGLQTGLSGRRRFEKGGDYGRKRRHLKELIFLATNWQAKASWELLPYRSRKT